MTYKHCNLQMKHLCINGGENAMQTLEICPSLCDSLQYLHLSRVWGFSRKPTAEFRLEFNHLRSVSFCDPPKEDRSDLSWIGSCMTLKRLTLSNMLLTELQDFHVLRKWTNLVSFAVHDVTILPGEVNRDWWLYLKKGLEDTEIITTDSNYIDLSQE